MRVIKISNELDYTKLAKENFINYEDSMYEGNSYVYDAMNRGYLSYDNILWYQAFEGFKFLSQPCVHLALELRRFIFRNVLNGNENKGVYSLPDRTSYDSLTNPKLIDRMVEIILKYNKDVSKKRIQSYLLNGDITRELLIKTVFFLGADREEFDKILSSGAFFRKLSPAVPKELIMLYCFEKNLNDRVKTFKELLALASEYLKNAETQDKVVPKPTTTYEGECVDFKCMSQNRFQSEFLIPCCNSVVHKLDSEGKQFSQTAMDLVSKNSVLELLELEGRYHTLYLANPDDTVFKSSTVLNYVKKFLPNGRHKDYGFPDIKDDVFTEVMSQNLFCRFLNYRITTPKGRKIYSMEFGSLPRQISENILTYPEFVNFPTKSHRINRYDILILCFYSFIMEHWENNVDNLIIRNQSEAKRIWKKFFKYVNKNLKQAGYETLSFKNPLDVLIKISMHALNPLECYNRIYELNIISSFINEEGENKNYPSIERIKKVIASLENSYDKMKKLKLISSEHVTKVKEFCECVRNKVSYSST